MKKGKFKKQSFEEFIIAADFSANMDLNTEDLVLGSCTVVAEDVDGNDASTTVLDGATKAIGTGTEKGYLKILVKAGTEAGSPYKITFKGVTDSTPAEKWEKDVEMTIKEL